MLPSFLLPHKHYTEETISGVLDDVVKPTDEDSEEHPSERTMIRWHHWLMVNEFTIDGLMKSIAFRELGYTKELLYSSISLLSHLKSSIPDGWLSVIIRYIYNSGNKLMPVY